MRALTIRPLVAGSADVTDLPDPVPADGEVLVDGLAVGVCGTDREIVAGEYGGRRPAADRLVLGHESLGRVRAAPAGSGFAAGDLVVGVVRRPDPVPCGACARGEFDMCRNGRYTERGIKELDGYASELWTVEAEYAVQLDPRLERRRRADGAHHRWWPRRGSRWSGSAPGPGSSRGGCWSPAPGRSGCWPRCSACSAAGRARARPGHATAEARRGGGARRHLPRDEVAEVAARLRAGRRDRGDRRRRGGVRRDRQHAPVRHRLPDRVSRRSAGARRRRRRRQPGARAGERRGGRLGQRQPAPLRGRGARRWPGRTRLAGPADHPPGAAGDGSPGVHRGPDDIKVVLTLTEGSPCRSRSRTTR